MHSKVLYSHVLRDCPFPVLLLICMCTLCTKMCHDEPKLESSKLELNKLCLCSNEHILIRNFS